MSKSQVENRFLYFLEGIACMAVIFIHCMFPSWLGVFVCGLARFAVPLFFLVSGYFLYPTDIKPDQMRKRMRRKIIRIGGLLIATVLFYLIWTMMRVCLNGGMESVRFYIYELIQPKQWFATLVLNDFTMIGGHLWFLAALLYCYLIYMKIGRFILKCVGYKSILILLGIHVCGRFWFSIAGIDSIFGISVYIWFRNWFFMAFPFFTAGIWIRYHQNYICSYFSKRKLVCLFGSGIWLSVIEAILTYWLTGEDRELYLGTFLMVFSMFFYAIQMPEKPGILWIENIGRHYLLFLYIMHLAVTEGINLLCSKVGLGDIKVIPYTKPFLVVGITMIGAVLWEKMICYRTEPRI